MLRIDADTHVDESEATWEYMSEAEQRYRPVSVDPGAPTVPGDVRPHRLWLIDGQPQLRRWRDDKRTGTVQATRELTDVAARIEHMDRLGVGVQVIYPTLFIAAVTSSPEVELALCRSYNRWIAKATSASQGRLRWVVVPPLLSIDKAIEELRFGKEHGAVGVFKKGFEAGRWSADPYFYPLYEEAARLDMPICIHTGGGDPSRSPLALTRRDDQPGGFNAVGAFTGLVTAGVPERIPELRIGFIETGASWIPYLVADLIAKFRRATFHPFDLKEDLFRRYRIYVTCQTNDDLPYILQYGTEDNLMIGSDYTHADQSAEIEALSVLEQKEKAGEIPPGVAQKILEDNPRRFYGI